MMMQECMTTCYVLFWIVVVPPSDPKDLFVERVTMQTMQSTWLICVGLVKNMLLSQFCGYSGRKGMMRVPGLRRWSGFIS
jgi:hypothetical protein